MTRTANDFRNLGTVHNRAFVDTNLINTESRTIPFVLVSKDNAGLRYDFWEDEIYEERLDPTGAKFDRLSTFFKDHRMSVDTAIGRIENVRVDNGEIKADVVFGTDQESDVVFNKYREGILTDVSIGYTYNEVTINERKGKPPEVVVNRFEIHELSAVWKGFDKNAKVGREHLKEEVSEREETPDLRKSRLRRLKLAEATTK